MTTTIKTALPKKTTTLISDLNPGDYFKVLSDSDSVRYISVRYIFVGNSFADNVFFDVYKNWRF